MFLQHGKNFSDAVDKAKEAGYGGIITYQSAYAFLFIFLSE